MGGIYCGKDLIIFLNAEKIQEAQRRKENHHPLRHSCFWRKCMKLLHMELPYILFSKPYYHIFNFLITGKQRYELYF